MKEEFFSASLSDDVEQRILRLLAIYPKISPSMLQIGIGSSLPTKLWRPVLSRLIYKGKVSSTVVETIGHNGRCQKYTIISLIGAENVG